MTFNAFWNQLRRQSRGGRSRLLFFVACLALGVAAVVAVAGFSEGLDKGVRTEAKQLLAADVSVRGRRPIPPELLEAIDAIRGARRTDVREMLTLVAAIPPEDALEPAEPARSLLVELKVLDGPYPFYGELELIPPGPLAPMLTAESAVAAPELLTRLGMESGDRLKIGDAEFRITAVVKKEPDRIAGRFSMGPRLFLSADGLERAGLERLGSRVVYRTLVALPPALGESVEAVKTDLEDLLAGNIQYTVETYEEAQPALRRGLQRMERYLGLAALLSLLIGGVGVAQTIRAWISGRMDSIAVLKCLGYRPREVLGLYLGQTVLLGVFSSVVGIALGVGVQLLAMRLLDGVLPVEYIVPWQPLALLRGLLLGVGVALLFGLPPLLAARDTPPIRVLRRDAQPLPPSRSVQRLQALALGAGVFLLAAAQSRSLVEGGLFTAGLAAAVGLLWLAAGLLTRFARRPRKRSRLWLRHGLAALQRRGGATRSAIVALGLGVFVVLSMALVQRGLDSELRRDLPEDAPSTFFIDIQPDQWPEMERLLTQLKARGVDSVPMVNARLDAVDGQRAEALAEELEAEGKNARWALRREQRLTYLEDLAEGNEIVEGVLWGDPQLAEVSVEQEYAELLGLDLGSVIRFDIQGVPIELTVTSIRTVNWDSFGINFYLVVEPGVLEDAPQARIAAARLPRGQEQAAQDQIAAAFPNVTAIQIREVLERVAEMLRRLALGVRLLGFLTIGAGLAILAGAVSAGEAKRGREVALYKTLGMTRQQIASAFAVEYGLVGLVAGIIGSLGGGVLAYFVLTEGMDVSWTGQPLVFAAALVLAVVLSVGAGLLASAQALQRRPVEVLRSVGD